MKVLRSLEWEPVAWLERMPTMDGPVYLFKHRRWRDVMALKVAKYVDVAADVVYFMMQLIMKSVLEERTLVLLNQLLNQLDFSTGLVSTRR